MERCKLIFHIKKQLVYTLMFTVSACNGNQTNTDRKDEVVVADTIRKTTGNIKKKENTNNESIRHLGVWTDGSTENATMEINKDSIFYLNNFSSHKYSLSGDTIKIYYPGWTFVGITGFIADTLVISSKDQIDKFWKFKE